MMSPQEIQESLEFALQSSRMGVWHIDLVSNTVSCSQVMLDIWEIEKSKFTGDRLQLQSRVHPDDREAMKEKIARAIELEEIYELEYRLLFDAGREKWVISRGRCTFEKDSRRPARFSGVVYEITERKLKDQALAEALKVRDLFFSIASHELKTPLTSLLLQQQVLEWDLKNQSPPEKLSAGLKKQREQLERINRIVNHVLDESKMHEGPLPMQLEFFDLAGMVAAVVDQFRINAQAAGVELEHTYNYAIQGIWDRFRLEQVLLNLLTNALRYGEKKPISVSISSCDKEAHIKVRDHGRGIDLKDQQRIFNQKERLAGDAAGSGLGLFITKNIVQAHGGRITVNSELGLGAEFTIILPLNRR